MAGMVEQGAHTNIIFKKKHNTSRVQCRFKPQQEIQCTTTLQSTIDQLIY